MAAILRGSSHTKNVTREMLYNHAPKINSAKGYGGLQVLTPRDEDRETQFTVFQNEIIAASETNDTLALQSLSNDYEKVLMKVYEEGQPKELLRLKRQALERWTALTPENRANHNHQKLGMLVYSSQRFLKRAMKQYCEVLTNLVEKTKLKTVYQCSVLERRYLMHDETHLDILFATLNSYLEVAIKNLEAKNAVGERVSFKFIKLTFQYHSETPFWGFREGEVYRWYNEKNHHRRYGRYRKYRYPVSLTHRSESSTRILLEYINKNIG